MPSLAKCKVPVTI